MRVLVRRLPNISPQQKPVRKSQVRQTLVMLEGGNNNNNNHRDNHLISLQYCVSASPSIPDQPSSAPNRCAHHHCGIIPYYSQLRLSSWVALSISCHLLFCGAGR
jgi:hypothetical protein